MGKHFFSLKTVVTRLKSPPLFLCGVHQPSIRLRGARGSPGGVGGGCPPQGWMRGAEGAGVFLRGLTHVGVLVCVCGGRNATDTFELFLDQINQHFRRGFLQIHKLQLCQENTNCLQFSLYPFSPPSVSVFPHWIIFDLSGNVVKCLRVFQWKCHHSKNA